MPGRPGDRGLPGSVGGGAGQRHGCRGFAVAGPGSGRAGGRRRLLPDGSQMPALGERSGGGMGGRMVFRTCHHAVGGSRVRWQWRRRVSIGEVLATARGQAGLTMRQVSQRTRIRETIIGGIERDDFSACGGDFYARGTRAIARAVGVDGEPLVGEYDSTHGTPQASPEAGLPGPSAPPRPRRRRRPNGSVALLVVLAAAAAPTYHLAASGPAGGAPAAARKPAVSAHRPPARTRRRRTRVHPPQRAMAHARW